MSVYHLQEKEKARKTQEAQKKEKALKEKEDKQKAKEKKDKDAKEKKKGRGMPGKDSLPEAFEDEDEEVVEETQMDDDDDDDARRCSSPGRAHSQTLPSFTGRLLTLRAFDSEPAPTTACSFAAALHVASRTADDRTPACRKQEASP